MKTDDALLKLAESTADAVESALEQLVPGQVERGPVSLVARGVSPFEGAPLPGVASRVSYLEGTSGGTIFLINRVGLHKLAALMMGEELPEVWEHDLGEVELSALSEAANQMLAAAAAAMGLALEENVEITPPETRTLDSPADADAAYAATPHATVASFTLAGEPCLLVQLVPNAHVVRMTRALEQFAEESERGPRGEGALPPEALLPLRVRVAAELGRARAAVGDVIGMRPGAVVELDRGTDEPIDVLVNGRLFARGRLILTEDEVWAVRLEEIAGSAETALGAPAAA